MTATILGVYALGIIIGWCLAKALPEKKSSHIHKETHVKH